MRNYFYVYYEGYDVAGNAIFNGNGSFYTDGPATPSDIEDFVNFLQEDNKKYNPNISRILIKNLTKL
ncbi:hypothetical protein ACMGDF_00035 [Morganella morganii]|uniref:hypothetical protein n=1 Tax=Morganella morganii TaxID=582 RepID=UPI0031AB3D92